MTGKQKTFYDFLTEILKDIRIDNKLVEDTIKIILGISLPKKNLKNLSKDDTDKSVENIQQMINSYWYSVSTHLVYNNIAKERKEKNNQY